MQRIRSRRTGRRAVLAAFVLAGALQAVMPVAPEARAATGFEAVELRPSARIQVDSVHSADRHGDEEDGAFLRGARFGATARWGDGVVLKTEFDVASDELEWENLYAGWVGPSHAFTLGERKVPGSLERMTSAGSLPFAERSAPVDALTDSSRLGLFHQWRGLGVTLQTMAYAGSANDASGDARGWEGLAHRAVLHPGRDAESVWHLGLYAGHERRTVDDQADFRAGPEVRFGGERAVDLETGVLDGVDGLGRGGVELAFQRQGWTLQAEALAVRLDRDRARTLVFHGGHTQLAWRPSGEARAYDGARFGDPDARAIEAGGTWEFLLRYSRLDLRDEPVTAGVQDALTVGVNWHGGGRVVIKSNWIRSEARNGGGGVVPGGLTGTVDRNLAVLRVQVGL